MIRKGLLFAAAAASFVVLSAPAAAHGSMEPSHGGVTTMTGETLVEFVQTPEGGDFYISEEDLPLNASDYSGTVTVTAGDEKTSTPLVAEAGNKLSATGLEAPAGSKVVVAITPTSGGPKTFATFAVD
ncbi:hypothetical protein [Novosphingobium aquimarinum]|uniref:hypothetical protein n=1 Tax=Novosphingobium aquimarinum TaxID=2682494 RepID=UPI0012EB7397|nr:hypothetical protein [Novosphingobium aquimarinum]